MGDDQKGNEEKGLEDEGRKREEEETGAATPAGSGPASGGGLASGGPGAGTGAEWDSTPPNKPRGGIAEEEGEEGPTPAREDTELPPDSAAASRGTERTTGQTGGKGEGNGD